MGKFDDDRARVIDLLYRKYCHYKKRRGQKEVEVKIYYEELQSYDMNYDLFCEILSILEKEKVVRIIRQYEYNDETFASDYGNDERYKVPSVADIECGCELEELYNSLIAGANTNHKGVSARKRRRVADLDFPEKVQWEKVRIEVKEDSQSIDIFYNDHFIANKDYSTFGLHLGEKQGRAWEFLIKLSACYNSGTKKVSGTIDHFCIALGIYKEDGITLKQSLTRSNVHRIKNKLSNKLKEHFDTDADPFDEFQAQDSVYQPVFTLLPPPILRHKDIWKRDASYKEDSFEDDKY